MPIHLEIVTAERVVLSDDVDMINAPTKDGRVGILPRHAPLLTILEVGELDIVKDGVTTPFAISGGFMEVLPNRVTILADTAERADEIDEARRVQSAVSWMLRLNPAIFRCEGKTCRAGRYGKENRHRPGHCQRSGVCQRSWHRSG
jgi:ATP synthase F1 epsilon subunit